MRVGRNEKRYSVGYRESLRIKFNFLWRISELKKKVRKEKCSAIRKNTPYYPASNLWIFKTPNRLTVNGNAHSENHSVNCLSLDQRKKSSRWLLNEAVKCSFIMSRARCFRHGEKCKIPRSALIIHPWDESSHCVHVLLRSKGLKCRALSSRYQLTWYIYGDL